MRLRFLGASGEVTGSCYLLETSRARVLIDFGMHQGHVSAERKNRRMPPIRPSELDAIVLTHAHLDHAGRLPLLPRASYSGPIYATPATISMCDILLRDAAYIQESDAERANRRRRRAGRKPARPLYVTSDVEAVLTLFKEIEYEEPREVAPGVHVRLVDAGHILGSASVQMTVEDHGEEKTIVFSGDIGPSGAPLLRDPTPLNHADVVVMESTYGDHDHRSIDETIAEFESIIREAHTGRGKILIPSFAVGRTQQLIYYLGEMQRDGGVTQPKVFVDSPMATKATTVYRAHRPLFDEESWALIDAGDAPLNFPGLRFTKSADESRALNNRGDGIIVIAASGMCTGGRILHHLRHNLWKRDVHVVFVGFQAYGTLGRELVEGAKHVRVFNDRISVQAKVHTLGGFSAHAGQSALVQWASSLAPSKPRVFLTHGENGPRQSLKSRLESELGFEDVGMPSWGDIAEL